MTKKNYTNYKIVIEYNGTDFEGFQVQNNRDNTRTVQGTLNKIVNELAQKSNENIKVIGASRTDSGVHATGQVANFVFPYSIPEEKMLIALNSKMPKDLLVREVKKVDLDFHSRFGSKGKRYRYKFYVKRFNEPFFENSETRFKYHIDEELIQEAKDKFLGEHDFTGFSGSLDENKIKVRNIKKVDFIKKGDDHYEFVFEGDAFLYNQIRVMAGVLLEVGANRLKKEYIDEVLKNKVRLGSSPTAPARGLYLEKVFY